MEMTINSKKYWGEMDDDEDSFNGYDNSFMPDVMADIERSMNKFCLAEFDDDYEENIYDTDDVILQPTDQLMHYGISLHKYANDMSDMIRVAELAIESDLIPPADAAPPIPLIPEIIKQNPSNSFNFIPKEHSLSSTDQMNSIPELSSTVIKYALSKSVATMLAHIGFETTHQSILDMLTDVLEEFLKKISYHIKMGYEDEEKEQLCGFPNVIERVLVELGIGGVKGLNDYYKTRIIKYTTILQKRCQELNKHYESLLIRKIPSPDEEENKMIRVKVEEHNDIMQVDNPQVHLAIEGEVGFSSLDAGYQLLSSLEAGSSSQGLGETEEDTSITISPGIVSISETDLTSTLSPFSKKKRTK